MFWQILKNEQVELLPGQPRMQNTSLGWILGGHLTNVQGQDNVVCNLLMNDELNHHLERFWQTEEISERRYYSPEEQRCEEHFQATVQRIQFGR